MSFDSFVCDKEEEKKSGQKFYETKHKQDDEDFFFPARTKIVSDKSSTMNRDSSRSCSQTVNKEIK